MLLHLSTWPEIEDYLKRSKTVVVPIGSNEQHGPTGLLGTDWLCPEIIAHEAQKTSDLLIAPTFNIGMAQHHLGFPGTIALMMQVRDRSHVCVGDPGKPRCTLSFAKRDGAWRLVGMQATNLTIAVPPAPAKK